MELDEKLEAVAWVGCFSLLIVFAILTLVICGSLL